MGENIKENKLKDYTWVKTVINLRYLRTLTLKTATDIENSRFQTKEYDERKFFTPQIEYDEQMTNTSLQAPIITYPKND